MPPKKKGKKQEAPVVIEEPMKNVIRTFYELQIQDITKKVKHLETDKSEYLQRNSALEDVIRDLLENREDELGKLNKSLLANTNKYDELICYEKELLELRRKRNENHDALMNRKDLEFREMNEELSSQIKLLTTEYVELKYFSINREELVGSFDILKKDYSHKEETHQNRIKELEKDFAIHKIKVKQNVDKQLLQLSVDFVNTCGKRVAAHTQRLIRENIALNNEMNRIMVINKNLMETCAKTNTIKINLDNYREETEHKNQAIIHSCVSQVNTIKRVTKEYETITENILNEKHFDENLKEVEAELLKRREKLKQLTERNGFMEQIIQGCSNERAQLRYDVIKLEQKNKKLKSILQNIKLYVKMVGKFCCKMLGLDEMENENENDNETEMDTINSCCPNIDDTKFMTSTINKFTDTLMDIIKEVDEDLSTLSITTIESIQDIYRRGITLDEISLKSKSNGEDKDDDHDDDISTVIEDHKFKYHTYDDKLEENTKPDTLEIDQNLSRIGQMLSSTTNILDVETSSEDFICESEDEEPVPVEEEDPFDEMQETYSSDEEPIISQNEKN